MQPFQPVEAERAVPIRADWGRRGLSPLQECAKVLPEMENGQLLLFSPDKGQLFRNQILMFSIEQKKPNEIIFWFLP